MSSLTPRTYQTEGIDALVNKYIQGKRRLLFQLATGGGKTVTFSLLIYRFLAANPEKKVVIAVHREELLKQARQTLYNWYGIVAEAVTAGVKYINPNSQVYVTMVETANNRLAKRPNFFGNVGVLIVDEAHLGNFKKLLTYFDKALIVGFTATPISASKKHPMKETYEDIVCGIDIPDLIRERALMPNRTYVVKSVDRKSLAIKNGEFDSDKMGVEFGKPKHVHNCIEGYERHGAGTKALIFNCNVQHSKLVTEAFIAGGYQAKHLDGSLPTPERESILQWFKDTPNAILNNIGVLTTGFDEPSVQTVIVNRSTTSVPLWLQMTGRGSRPFAGKSFFTIIDMGGNAKDLGDWCQSRDWEYIFHNPKKPGEGGVAPVKECVACEALIPASSKICSHCGEVQPGNETEYDSKAVEFELLDNSISVPEIVHSYQVNGYKDYAVLHQVKTLVVKKARDTSGNMDYDRAYLLLDLFQQKVQEWCRTKGKDYNQWHKETTSQWLFQEIERVFKWKPETLSIAL